MESTLKKYALMMRDHPEFIHLESFEEFFKELEGTRTKEILSQEKLNTLCALYSFTEEQKDLLTAILEEKGYDI